MDALQLRQLPVKDDVTESPLNGRSNKGMSAHVHCCSDMADAVDDDTYPLVIVSRFREFGIRILDGGASYKRFTHCPWCGVRLPESMRNAWFDELEKRGIEPADEQSIPDMFKNESWYSSE